MRPYLRVSNSFPLVPTREERLERVGALIHDSHVTNSGNPISVTITLIQIITIWKLAAGGFFTEH